MLRNTAQTLPPDQKDHELWQYLSENWCNRMSIDTHLHVRTIARGDCGRLS